MCLDTLMNALALVLAARLCAERPSPWRVLLAAAFGALAARMADTLPRMGSAALWLPVALGMMALLLGKKALRRPMRYAALLLASYGLLGGVVLSLYGATGSLLLAYALGGVCTLAMAASALRERRAAALRAQIDVAYRGRKATFEAMIDSGNTLRDYLTRLPVIVLPEQAARERLHLGDAPLRPIFADTAGGRQMMGALLPEAVAVIVGGRRMQARAIIALSPGLRGDAPALAPPEIMDNHHGQRGI